MPILFLFSLDVFEDAVREVFGLTYYEDDEACVRQLMQLIEQNRRDSFSESLLSIADLVDQHGKDRLDSDGHVLVRKVQESAFLRAITEVVQNPSASLSPLISVLRRLLFCVL